MLRPDPATICCSAAMCCSKAARPVAVSRGRGPRALAHEDAADLDIAGLLQGGELFGEGRVGQAHAVPDELEVGPLRLGCSASTAVSLTPFGSSPPVCLAPHPSAWQWLACRWAVVPPLAGTTAHRPASGSRHRRAAAEQGANRDTPQGASHLRLNPVHHTAPKPESRIRATSYLGLPPTHARPGAWLQTMAVTCARTRGRVSRWSGPVRS